MKKDKLKVMKRPLLKLYAFNFFQALSWASQKKRAQSSPVFGFAVLFVWFFISLFARARFPAFLFARVNLPIESKVWSRVARTNYRRNMALLLRSSELVKWAPGSFSHFNLIDKLFYSYIYMKEDHLSYRRNFCSCEKKA